MKEAELSDVPVALSLCTSTAHGRAAELRAASMLMGLGHRVAVPLADDDGVDLVVDYRVRVQVKVSTGALAKTNASSVRDFTYERYHWADKRNRWAAADVFLFCGVSASGDRWWVVPAAVLVGSPANLNFYSDGEKGVGPRLAPYEDAWEVFGGEGVPVAGVSGGEGVVAGGVDRCWVEQL